MRWFFDCEFDEDGRTIDLISIAMVSEIGQTYSACLADGWSEDHCSAWVKTNVLPRLPPPNERKTREQVARDIIHIVGGKPEFWAYCSAYDWVALCQLYGPLVERPAGWPSICCDLKQLLRDWEIPKSCLLMQPEDSKHDALADALWVRDAWLSVQNTIFLGGDE